MTVNTELARAEFDWTGVESAFVTGFPADKAADVAVFYRTPAGVITTLVAGVNYSVNLATGSKIVTVVPLTLPAAPGTVVVRRRTPALVSEVLQDGEGFSLAIIQQLHDRAAMRSAEDRDLFSRAIVLAEGAELGAGAFDFGGSGIDNLAAGTTSSSAATVAQVQAILAASGNVPAPVLADVGRFLKAVALGEFAWTALALSDLGNIASGVLLGRVAAEAGPIQQLSAAQGLQVLGITDSIVKPGTPALFLRSTAPAGYLKGNGAVIDRAVYAALDAEIYCGDAANATATWGYRTNSSDTVRSTTGTHIKLPDGRGEFFRGWDDGRGVDSGRSLWSAQADELKSHAHTVGGGSAFSAGGVAFAVQGSGTNATISATGGAETRPRNLAFLFCIKF